MILNILRPSLGKSILTGIRSHSLDLLKLRSCKFSQLTISELNHSNHVKKAVFMVTNIQSFSTSSILCKQEIPILPQTTNITDPPFVDMGLGDGWSPVSFLHSLLEIIHVQTNIPWWATIMLGTIIIRGITVPFFIANRNFLMRRSIHKEKTDKLTRDIQKAKNNNYFQASARQAYFNYLTEHKIGATKGIYGLVQPFFFITWLRGIRQMCFVPVPSLVCGGTLWFNNLVAPDGYLLLPLISGIMMSLSLNNTVGVLTKSKYIKMGIYSIPIVMPLLAATPIFEHVSSAIFLYIATNSAMSFVITTVMSKTNFGAKYIVVPPHNAKRETVSVLETLKTSKDKTFAQARQRTFRSNVKSANKQRKKQRAKELKGDPPITFSIGSEAVLQNRKPDFKVDRRPPMPRVN